MRKLQDHAQFTDEIVVPESGDPANAEPISKAFQALANRTRYLYEELQSLKATIQDKKKDS